VPGGDAERQAYLEGLGDAELAAAFCAHLGRGWRCPAAISKGRHASNSVWVWITSETFPQ
jgi:hypothetical protein